MKDVQPVPSKDIVYIVDDDSIIRRSLSLTVRAAGYKAHPFMSGEDMLEAASYIAPGCVLLDMVMPGMTGPEVQRQLAVRRPEMPILFMSAEANVPAAVRAMKNGALDFIEKPFTDTLLLDVLGEAFKGLSARSDRERRMAEAAVRLERLTPRERQVLDGLLDGLSNKLVAERLRLSVRTAEMHRANLMAKLDIRNLAEAAQIVFIAGALN